MERALVCICSMREDGWGWREGVSVVVVSFADAMVLSLHYPNPPHLYSRDCPSRDWACRDRIPRDPYSTTDSRSMFRTNTNSNMTLGTRYLLFVRLI
jgi:hypothetical protein